MSGGRSLQLLCLGREAVTDNPILRRRISVYVFLFLPGLALASWVTRTPAIRDSIGASTAEMGLLLLGVSVGSMTGILSSAALVRRFGTKRVITNGLSLLLAGMVLVAVGGGSSSAPVVFLGFMFFGLGVGSAEVAVNIEGADVERILRAPVLVELHGCFSLGTFVGAVLGIGFTAFDVPILPSLLGIVAVSALALVWALAGIAPGFGVEGSEVDQRENSKEPEPLWKDTRLVLIAVILLAMALAEGAATDWLPLLMVDDFDLAESSGSLVFAAFAAMMTVGRFGGRFLLERYGRVAILRFGALISAVGVTTVIFVGDPVIAGLAVTLWGLGVSLGFPVLIAAASDSGPDEVGRVGLVASAGYVAFLVGPPLLGYLGEHFSLSSAMLVVLAVLILAAILAPAAGSRNRSP